MRRPLSLFLGFAGFVCLAGGGFAACAINPVSGRPELVLVSGDRERALGDEQEAGLLDELGLSDHEATRAWVASVGARVAAHSPRQDVRYRFHVADLEVPNAFALPGGPIFVTRGLLALVRSEDELAGVLGHEIAHVAARHTVRQATAATPLGVVFGLPAAIVGSVSRPLGDLVALPGALVSGLALSAYERDQEFEADRVGAELTQAAGLAPLGLARLLERLAEEEALHRTGPPPLSFFSSHPRTPDRLERVRAHALELSSAGTAPAVSSMTSALEQLDGLLVGPSPAQGVFIANDFLHPTLDISWRVPDGWEHENHAEAVVAYDPEVEARVALLLQLVGDGEDPAEAAVAEGIGPEQEKALRQLDLGGRSAAQLELTRGGDAAVLTWVAIGGRIYRVVGICPVAELGARHGVFTEAAGWLEPLDPADRARIQASRLRLRSASAAESLADFARRTASTWTPEELAVTNDLDPEVPLVAGDPLKVAIEEPWSARP
jgi:predicted Zn-dependent protease